MGLLDKLTNWVMPQEEVYEEEETLQVAEKKADTAAQRSEVRRVANGAPIFITDPQPVSRRPELTVHTNPAFAAPEMEVAVFTPVKFEDAAAIADAIKEKRAAIVNFERTDAREQQRIFERFYRVDKSHSKSMGGTGLGLSIVKHAAKIHNASIELTSVIDGGTTVTIIFPKNGLLK